MDMRGWLIVLGVLVLVGAAADAFRRVRNRNRLRLDIDNKFKDLPDVAGDDVGEVRLVGGDAPATQKEPSFQDDNLVASLASADDRREPELAEPRAKSAPSDDIDLLLADDFQGVGEGAGDYLGEARVVSPAEPEVDPSTKEGAVPRDGSAPKEIAIDEPLVVAAEAPYEAAPEVAVEPQFRSVAEVSEADGGDGRDESQTVSPEPLAPEPGSAESFSSAVDAHDDRVGNDSAEPSVTLAQPSEVRLDEPESSPSDDNAAAEQVAEQAAEQVVEQATEQVAEQAAEQVAEQVAEPLPASASREGDEPMALTMVSREADSLDLTRPVPEILAEQARMSAADSAEDHDALASSPPEESDAVTPATAADSAADASSTTAADKEIGAAKGADDGADPTPAQVAKAIGGEAGGAPKKASKGNRRRQPRPEVQTDFFEQFPDLTPDASVSKRKSGATRTRKPSKPKEQQPAPDEVLVITVMSRHEPFNGRVLFKLIEACGLTFGKMNIFHRHEQEGGAGPVQFSMVNAVHPGTFEPDTAVDFSTPGVTLFLTMSEPSKLMEAFDCMLATAQCLADNLDGELRDEHRSSLRTQTIEHYRHKVRDFERRRLARRA